jgi:hypothetical protein
MPAELAPLSDEAAAEILEFLHELVVRFEAQYFVQLRRFHDQQRDFFDQTPPAPLPALPDEDAPF